MRYFLGVDLAARYSAALLMSGEFGIEGEWVSDFGPATTPPVPQPNLRLTAAWWRDQLVVPGLRAVASGGVVGVEDVHPHAINDKPALRTQGALLLAMDDDLVPARLLRVFDWQHHFGYKKTSGRTVKAWAKQTCADFGYDPQYGGKKDIDLRDAYLLARYLVETS